MNPVYESIINNYEWGLLLLLIYAIHKLGIFYSIKKSYKLKKISKILYRRSSNSLLMLSQIPYSDLMTDQKKYIDTFNELMNFCETDRFIKLEMEYYKIDRNYLRILYVLMDDEGARVYTKGHCVLISTFFYPDTLHYCLEKTKDYLTLSDKTPEENSERMKKDNTIVDIVERCFMYFAQNEFKPIIKSHKKYYKQ